MRSEPIPYLSVCSGIEAFSVAVHNLDFKPVAFAEIEDFPSRVLAYRFPDVPNLGDMTMMHTGNLGHVGWLVGGTPCQSFSIAGMRAGLDDERGNLTLEYVKLAHRLADNNGLRGLLWENVPGCLSDKTNAFGCFLGALVGHDGPLYPGDKPAYGKSSRFWTWVKPREKEPVYDDDGEPTGEFTIATEGYHRAKWPDIGMVAGPRARAAWRILDSRYFGVPQRRRRVFVVADFGNGPDPAAVLFEPRGQRRSVTPSRQAGEGIAGTLGGSSQSGGFRTTDLDNNGAFITHSLTGEGHDASEDGTGRGTPLVVDTAPTLRAGGNKTGGHRPPGSDVDTVETLVAYMGNAEGGNPDAPSLNASNGKKGINNQTGLVMVFDPNQMTNPTNRSQPEAEVSHTMPATERAPVLFSFNSKDHGQDASEDIAPTLRSAGHDGSHANAGAPPAIAFNPKGGGKQTTLGMSEDVVSTLGTSVEPAVAFNLRGREGGNMPELGTDQASALRSADGGSSAPMAMAGMQVRRLTPTECERLQGFPDGWTLVPGLSGWRAVGDDEDIEELRSSGLTVKVNKKTGRARVNDPDGPRYKSLGNSFTTEPVNWIMTRVQASLRGEPMPDWQPMRLWGNGR